MKQYLAALVLTLSGFASSAMATVPALDVSDATTYLETNAGGGISEIGVVMLTLAGLAVAIKWVKATFFG